MCIQQSLCGREWTRERERGEWSGVKLARFITHKYKHTTDRRACMYSHSLTHTALHNGMQYATSRARSSSTRAFAKSMNLYLLRASFLASLSLSCCLARALSFSLSPFSLSPFSLLSLSLSLSLSLPLCLCPLSEITVGVGVGVSGWVCVCPCTWPLSEMTSASVIVKTWDQSRMMNLEQEDGSSLPLPLRLYPPPSLSRLAPGEGQLYLSHCVLHTSDTELPWT